MKEVMIQLIMLIIRAPNKADQNPETAKPDITPDTIIKRKALITNVKSPRLSILIGNVIKNNIGLKKAFKIPKIAAANTADKKPSIWMPSKI